MARAHEVAIGADGRDFNRGMQKDVIKPTEDAARALDDLGRDGSGDLGKLEDALRDVQRQSEKTETAARDVGQKGFADAGESTKAFKQEAVANFSEVASSFSGDITEMADGVQGLTGGLASALTPGVGIPIAIVGALAGAFLQSWITASEDSEQRVEDMFARMTEAGQKFAGESQIKEAIEDLDTEQVAAGIERARDLSIEQGAVLRAMVGDTQALAAINQELVDRRNEDLDAIRNSGASIEDQAVKVDAVNTKYAEQSDWLRDIQNDTQTAADKWDAVNSAIDWTGGKVSTLASQIAGLAGGVTIPIRIDTTSAYAEADNLRRTLQSRGIKVPISVQGTLGGRQLL